MAFFLDLDGTLAEIVLNPADARLNERVADALERLIGATGGAVAIVSGRSIAEADRLLDPLILPIAGLHGAERRRFDGEASRRIIDEAALDALRHNLGNLAASHPGLFLELKPTGMALHYRAAPALADLARRSVEAALEPYRDRFMLQPGKMVLEIKPRGIDKGQAIAAFLEEPPFRGRPPVFAGDDLTDEAGFALVNAQDGLSIKVGEGETQARYRLPAVDSLVTWLSAVKEGVA